jgi:putative membrane protein
MLGAGLAVMITVAVAPAQTMGHLSAADKDFVMKTAMANNYEIAAAQAAQSMATAAADKTFAQTMIDDHTALATKLKDAVAAADPSLVLPTGMSAADATHLQTLKTSGTHFDATYRSQMITGHTAVLASFKAYAARSSANAGIKNVISGAVPTVQHHLDLAKQLPTT